MKNLEYFRTAILPNRESLQRSVWCWHFHSIQLIALLLAWFALSPQAPAICQQGCDDSSNTFLGEDALLNNAFWLNTAVGWKALTLNTDGDENTAIGASALEDNTIGFQNTALGSTALSRNTTGVYNVAIGAWALFSNTDGDDNTAIGTYALLSNSGSSNTATGSSALERNTGGGNNAATGYRALYNNTTGSFNTANGSTALTGNLTGGSNTADGAIALASNSTGSNNTGIGFSALGLNTTGVSNTAVGRDALLRNTTGSSNIAVGYGAGQNLTTGGDNIAIGNSGVAGDSGRIRIGITGVHTNTYVAGIYGTGRSRTSVPVYVDSEGRLGTSTSSARFKEAVKPMDKASEAILALRPITFRYKKEFDPEAIPQFGLIAEEVETVDPTLVVRDNQGRPYTVRYEAVNAMLLNEFLKEHKKIEEQQATIAELKSTVSQQHNIFQSKCAAQQKQLEALASGLERVRVRLDLEERPARVAKY